MSGRGHGSGRPRSGNEGRGSARSGGAGRSRGASSGRSRGASSSRSPSTPPGRSSAGARRGSTAAGPQAGGPGGPRSRSGGRGRPAAGLGGDQVEGRQAVRELLRSDRRPVRTVLMAEAMEASPILDEIEALAAKRRVRVEYVSHRRLDSVARTDGPQGVVALARPVEAVPLETLCTAPGGSEPFLLVLDGITDPHNVGALLRSAECAGVTGVVLPRHRSALLSPTVAKVAAGAIEYLPIALVAGIPAALVALARAGVWTIGMVGEARQPFYGLPLGDRPLALVVGSEGSGLAALVRKRCDVLASLPLHGGLTSLNVSVAGAVACYEVARRRTAGARSPSGAA